jgi:hypothetical protein
VGLAGRGFLGCRGIRHFLVDQNLPAVLVVPEVPVVPDLQAEVVGFWRSGPQVLVVLVRHRGLVVLVVRAVHPDLVCPDFLDFPGFLGRPDFLVVPEHHPDQGSRVGTDCTAGSRIRRR